MRMPFCAEHANVQPLSGSPMNQAAYFAFLKPGDTVLAMDLSHGGHLTHGAPVSHMGKVFRFVRYKTRVDRAGAIDFDEVMRLAKAEKPRIVLCGYTSYPRDYDYASFKRVADEIGALTMADVSHVGGLIAAGVMANPIDAGFDVVTTTTHKSLRGPRSGLILCRAEHAKKIDASLFPGLQGGPHMNTIAGVAITLKKAGEPAFVEYAKQVLKNAKVLAQGLIDGGASLITGGTDNHLMVVDTVKSFGLDGRRAEEALDAVGITTNKQVMPDDPLPLRPSGIRIGTPAITARGMNEREVAMLGSFIVDALRAPDDGDVRRRIAGEVRELSLRFPVPGIALSN